MLAQLIVKHINVTILSIRRRARMRPRRSNDGCRSECLSPWVSAPLAVLTCTTALVVPFASSLGLSLSSSFRIPGEVSQVPISAVVVALAWLIAVIVGATRRHESTIWCVIDSLGIPGVLVSVFYAIK
jgi:hypothetical protein